MWWVTGTHIMKRVQVIEANHFVGSRECKPNVGYELEDGILDQKVANLPSTIDLLAKIDYECL
jgi:hypothetical protein